MLQRAARTTNRMRQKNSAKLPVVHLPSFSADVTRAHASNAIYADARQADQVVLSSCPALYFTASNRSGR